ncbi:MAG: glycoside hydrolase family 127 protein [Oscillospiraceae bacterium]|jgi:hypothetical protein|nr:glycoside hydrolase family 127 protein [Oscillospiraceae bacterium]
MQRKIISLALTVAMILSLISAFGGVSLAVLTDEETVMADCDWLSLGDTSAVTSSLALPATGQSGSVITWRVGDSPYLWDDGVVIRPPSGKDVTATLTATVSFGAASQTKDFTVGIPAYESNIRTIDTVHAEPAAPAGEFNIDVAVGTCPKLPYRVWVAYTDGYGEWRQTQWPWSGIVGSGADRSGPPGSGTPANQEEIWKSYPIGYEYTVTGWITGDNASDLGYPLTVNCKVVADVAVPDHNVKADSLPMSKIKLTGENRLSSNARRAVTQYAAIGVTGGQWHRDTYLWNYRDVYGVAQPEGATPPTGWEAPNQKLRGHGVGHYINGLCLAYVSGLGTEQEREAILGHIVYMVDEMRKLQEMTFVQDPASPTGYREGSNVWPHYKADKDALSPDWPYPMLSEITSPPSARYDEYEFGNPQWFGYGYLHATAPIHPVLNEAYRPYSEWIWAPYYSIHKQLAGLMDVYYSLKDAPATRSTAEKALLICKDMSHWISDRLTTKCRIEDNRNTTTYGNLSATWYANISGEYGGVNEAIARCAAALDDSDPDKELLIRGSEMFDNKFYWDPLAVGSEIMWNGTAAIGGNSHANQRIPQMPGVLWSYRGNGEARYYSIAKNFFDFNAGRHRFYGGNVGVGEWYYRPYEQIAGLAANSAANEGCCATNLARLSKDLACFDPDNAEYMDYYERVTYNQLVGSVVQNTWNTTYQYALAPHTGKTDLRGTSPGQSCCGGTGAENALRYTDGAYLVSDKAIWVNMYMPTEVVWDDAGVTLRQDCLWPAEYAKITVAANEGQTQKPFDMHLRVPWWATRGFDIKRNGVSVADSYAPSSYVVLGGVTVSDVVEVICPFVESIDYAPDRRTSEGQRLWAGVIFNGPLAMSGVGAWSTLNINYDLSNIVKNAPVDLPDTSSATPGNNRNLYTMRVAGQSHSNADTLRPDYYTGFTAASYPVENTEGSGGRTVYYMINMVPSGDGADRTNLYASLRTVRAVSAEGYSSVSLAALRSAIGGAVGVYQDEDAAQAALNTQVSALQAAMDNLVPTQENKDDLLALVNTALGTKAAQEAWEALPDGDIDDKPCAPYGYARMLARLEEAQAVCENAEATMAQVGAAYRALDEAIRGIRLGYMPEVEDLDPLKALLTQAEALRANDYSLDSWLALLGAIDHGESEVTAITVGSSTINQDNIPDAMKRLQDAISGLVDDPAGDKTNLWASTNYAFFNGDGQFALESEGNYFREGALIDMREWSNLWHYHWRLQPDDNHEYFQFRKWSSASHAATTVLGPEAKAVAAGTPLVLVHGDASDDSQWWKPMRQPDGKFIIVNKADPTLCIAPMSPPPVAGGRLMLAPLNATDNTWRILGRANSVEAPGTFTEPLSRAVTSVAPLADVSIVVGTGIGDIALPARVSVTYEGNAKALRSITWDTSSFDSNTAGTYTLTGTVALDGIETNPDEMTARVTIVSLPAAVSLSRSGGEIAADFTVSNLSDDDVNALCILAVYDDAGRLTDVKTQSVTLAKDTGAATFTLRADEVPGQIVRGFVWQTAGAGFTPPYTPLCPAVQT